MDSNPIPYIWLLAVAVGATPILIARSRQGLRRRRSTAWKSAPASIHNIEQVDPHRGGGRYLRISYSYYSEEYRSGEYHFFVAGNLSGEEIARLLKGVTVEALYDPNDPEKSILTDANLYAVATRARKPEIPHEVPPASELSFDVAQYEKPLSPDTRPLNEEPR